MSRRLASPVPTPGSCPHTILCVSTLSLQTKTAVALLYDEESENAYDVRLKLTKEVLTIQKQDVICVGGSHQGRNVSAATSGKSRSVSEEPHEGSLKSVVQE